MYVYDDGDSPWAAIRIYEWQMFETAEFPQTEPVPMQFATAVNGAGATDTFTLTNVPAGQTVTVYTAAGDQIGQTVAEEATVTFTDLTLALPKLAVSTTPALPLARRRAPSSALPLTRRLRRSPRRPRTWPLRSTPGRFRELFQRQRYLHHH